MTEEQEKALDQVMTATLTRTIDFVKFAEAKNAALLTFASAWLLASATIALNETARGLVEVRMGLMIGAPLIAAAAFLALWSLMPRVNLKILSRSKECTNNLLFFGDLKSLETGKAGEMIRARYQGAGAAGQRLADAYFEDLGCQIVVNSGIAASKYGLFHLAVWVLFAGLAWYGFWAVNLVL